MFVVVSGCFISKCIVIDIEFQNLTNDSVKITCGNPEDSKTLKKGKSSRFNVSCTECSTEILTIIFSNSNQSYQYDLSELDLYADANGEKTLLGDVRWVYKCTINDDKTIRFKSKNQDNGFNYHILPKSE